MAIKHITPSIYPARKFKTRKLEPYVSRAPRPWREIEPVHERAIVIPWLSTGAKWDELRYAMRSIDRHFTDKECPIYVLCDKAPAWLVDGGRVTCLELPQYRESNEAGMWEAWQIGLQVANEVAWWNDDIYLLKDTGWDDMRVALTEGTLNECENELRTSTNSWRYALGDVCAELRSRGMETVWRFATHTPYLFECDKARVIMREFYLPFSGAFESYYHNWHSTPREDCGPHKIHHLPCSGTPRYLNHGRNGPDPSTREQLAKRFSEPAEWEQAGAAMAPSGLPAVEARKTTVPVIVSMATFPPRRSGLLTTVASLLPQCDRLRVYLNGYDEVPSELPDDPKLELVLAGPKSAHPDLGSHGKWHWLGNEDCYHLTVDDDIFYPPNYVDYLVGQCQAFGDRAIVGLHGIIFEHLRMGMIPGYAPYTRFRKMLPYHKAVDVPTPVHVLGSGVMCCRPSKIELTKEALGGALHSGDDEDLAIWAQANKVPMVRVLGYDGWVLPNDEQWRLEALHRRPEFRSAADVKIKSWKNWKLQPLPKP